MPPSELTPNYRADNNRGAQSCAAVCSRRKSGCRIAGCHAPFCRPRYYSPRPALSFNPSPPLSPSVCDYRKLSTIITHIRIHRSKRSAISFHSIPFACHAIDFEDVRYTSRGTRRDIVGPERECYWRKNSSRHELRGYFLSFRFRPTRLGIVSSSSSGIFNGDDL